MVKPQKIVTPIGMSSWCAINPDNPDTKFDPQWYVDLIVEKDDAKSFADAVKKFYEETRSHFGATKPTNPIPIKEHTDEEGNPTGQLVIKCKRKVGGTRKDGSTWTNKPPVLFGADGNPFTPDGSLGKGTKMRVSVLMKPYGAPKVGVMFEIASAQIIDANYYGNDASGDDFEAVEGTAKTTVPASAEGFTKVEGGDSFDF